MSCDLEHPYIPGITLKARILPNSGKLSDSAQEISANIDSLFLPFTKSQVMRATLHPVPGEGYPKNCVIKLYDRRFVDDRRKLQQLWSPSREAVARASWSEKRGWAQENLLKLEDEDRNGFDDAQWEEYFRQKVQVRDTI